MNESRPDLPGGEIGAVGRQSERSVLPTPHQWSERDFAPPCPESLAAPAMLAVVHREIDGDPHNIRQSLPAVQRLAWSIYMHGLLENLVVVEHPNPRAAGMKFELRAGSRRFEAIRRLIEGVEAPPGHPDRDAGRLWYWPADRPIPVRVLGSDGHYEHLVENIERSSPEPWEIGRRVNEVLSAGVTSRELGMRLGRSNGWVQRYAHIGRGLSPELIEILRREHVELRLGELGQLASIRDQFGDPNAEEQIDAFRKRRAKRRKRPRRIDPHSFRATMKRLQYLRADMIVPGLLRPVVNAIIEYLESGINPGFRALEEALFDKVKLFSPDTPEEL